MAKSTPITRSTVDLSGYPELIAIYLGMQARTAAGAFALLSTGREIRASLAAKPDGLLAHENFIFSLAPLHAGMRQYWRDLSSLEAWTREGLHRGWWTSFLRNPRGTSFWHETYRKSGGFEAIYDNMPGPVGMMRFAPVARAGGPMFSARGRLEPGATAPAAPISEEELA